MVNKQLTVLNEGFEVPVGHELIHQQLLHQILLFVVLVAIAK